MRMQFPDGADHGADRPRDPEWFRPLYGLWSAVPHTPPFDRFDPDDFMLMGRVLRIVGPHVTLYKHRFTRRYLNLDASSLTYRYVGPPLESFRSGEYRRQPLTDALRALGLDQLHRLKASPASAATSRSARGDTGHLRLVPAPPEGRARPATHSGAAGGPR